MESGSFKVEVYTGSGLVLSEETTEVVVPGIEGEVGFLHDHSEYVGNLGSGPLKIVGSDGRPKTQFIVSGGFARFSKNTLQVVTDFVDSIESINREKARSEATELETKISELSSYDPEFDVVNAKLGRLRAQAEFVG